MNVTRYHPMLVALHWLLVPVILLALIMGGNVLVEIPNNDPEKIDALRGHMLFGVSILLLTLVRIVTRVATKHPQSASSGHRVLDRLARPAHLMLYALVILMALSGVATGVLASLGEIVFFGSGGSLPASFDGLLPRTAHGLIAKLLVLTIVLHVLAALYHQFIAKDALMARMWFGRR